MPSRHLSAAVLLGAVLLRTAAGEPAEPEITAVRRERPGVVETLRELVSLESGSRDSDGLARIAAVLRERLEAVGATVEMVAHDAERVVFHDTPPEAAPTLVARLSGTGSRRIMLLGHMDTVYPRGTLARRPFRIEGTRAYGPGVADAKGGLAVILHALAILRDTGFRDYATLTVVINGDEEISTPGARGLIARLAAEHDVVLSTEPTSAVRPGQPLAVATSGVASATLVVRGRASHAGSASDRGRNALVELAHLVVETRGLDDAASGVRFNWTMADAGMARNVIPDVATAVADIRVRKTDDFDAVERALRDRVAGERLVPDTVVEVGFERRRPPLEASAASLAVAGRARAIYAELGLELAVDESGRGGGTDAAFAAESGKAAVVEGFGLAGANYHSSDEEYVDLESIEPRLYLLVRLVTELAGGR